MADYKLAPAAELRKIVTDALVAMVSAVTQMTPPTDEPLPGFIQAPIDRAVTRITAETNELRMLAAAPGVQGGPVLHELQLWAIRNHVAANEVTKDDDSMVICVKHGRAVERAVIAALQSAPQPAEQHPAPDVPGLVEALEQAYGTLERAVSPADETPEAAIQSAMSVIDIALTVHRKGGE